MTPGLVLPAAGARPPKPPFDRERFVFRILAVVIGTQLLIYSLAAGVCGHIRPRGEASSSRAGPEMVEAMAASTSLLTMPFHIAP